jgi:hypothetical protein
MRIWDLPSKRLCRNHLLGEHRELHAIWSVLVNGKKGYSRHPETLRWKGKLKALFGRHEALVMENEAIDIAAPWPRGRPQAVRGRRSLSIPRGSRFES